MKINASNATYDFLNALVRYILPGLATFYFAISQIWGLLYAEEVVGTIAAFELFAGGLIALARRGWKYEVEDEEDSFDGDLLVDMQEEGTDLLTVALDLPVDEVRGQDDIRLRVITSSHE